MKKYFHSDLNSEHWTVADATQLIRKSELQASSYDKVFSNAAMHWILRPENRREDFFRGVYGALKPNGVFCFEMGGMGNVAEVCICPFLILFAKWYIF